MNPWLVAVVVLAALLVGLSAWVAVDQTRSTSSEGQASPEVVAMLEDRLAAVNSGGWGVQLESVGPIYEWGRTMGEVVKAPGTEGTDWLNLYRVEPSGKISHQWVVVAGELETNPD